MWRSQKLSFQLKRDVIPSLRLIPILIILTLSCSVQGEILENAGTTIVGGLLSPDTLNVDLDSLLKRDEEATMTAVCNSHYTYLIAP